MGATLRNAKLRVRDPEFECKDCANTIERVLKKTPGVEGVSIHPSAGRIEVRYDPKRTTESELYRIIDEWGYVSIDAR